MPNPAPQLCQALSAYFGEPLATIVMLKSTSWCSATFTGARHELSLSITATDRTDRLRVGLPEAEFSLNGHIVADIRARWQDERRETGVLEIEALTVEAW